MRGAWVVLAYPVGVLAWVSMPGLVYYGMRTPLRMIFPLAGRDRVQHGPAAGEATYGEAGPAAAEPRRYLSQF